MRACGVAAEPSAERFEKLLAEECPAVRLSQARQRLLDSLDGLCSRPLDDASIRDMLHSGRSLGRSPGTTGIGAAVGPEDVTGAMEKRDEPEASNTIEAAAAQTGTFKPHR